MRDLRGQGKKRFEDPVVAQRQPRVGVGCGFQPDRLVREDLVHEAQRAVGPKRENRSVLARQLGLSYFWYRATEFRIFTAHTRYEDLRFESNITGGSLLSIYLILFVAFIGAGLVIGAVAASLVMITASIPEDVQDIDPAVAVVPGIAVVFVLIVLGILRQIIVVPRFTRLFCERLTVGGKADFAAIAQSQRPLPSRGEGLADILDMGGI